MKCHPSCQNPLLDTLILTHPTEDANPVTASKKTVQLNIRIRTRQLLSRTDQANEG